MGPWPSVASGNRGGGVTCSGASGAGLGLHPVFGSVVDDEARLYR